MWGVSGCCTPPIPLVTLGKGFSSPVGRVMLTHDGGPLVESCLRMMAALTQGIGVSVNTLTHMMDERLRSSPYE